MAGPANPGFGSGPWHNLGVLPAKRPGDLAEDLSLLASALEMLRLEGEELAGRGLEATRDRLARSIRSYLIPRLLDPEAPLIVAFAGPTGSGKSTLINSLSGLRVSETGPIRPTTKGPVVLASEEHAPSFADISGINCDVVVGRAPILSRFALVDAPDIDSTSTEHRIDAEVLIDNADVVVYVTSALRYADLVPWEVLRRALARGAPVIHVLNRVGADGAGAALDFRARLASEGIDAEVLKIPEHHLEPAADAIPTLAVRDLRRRLAEIARDMKDAKREVFSRVLNSTIDQIVELADTLDTAIEVGQEEREAVRSRFRSAARQLGLSDLGADLRVPDPPDGFWRRRSWLRRQHLSESEWAGLRSTLQRRLAASVESDIRSLIQETAGHGWLTVDLVSDLRTMTAAAVEAWFDQLARMAEVGRTSMNRLAGSVLAHAALEGGVTGALRFLFDDESIVVKAYRALVGRLEVVYEQIGGQVAASLDPLPVDAGDTERLREVAASIVVRSHFADA